MPNLENLTPFAAISLPSMAPDGADLLLAIVSGRFQLPPAGRPGAAPPRPCEEQRPVQLHDEHHGPPDASSLRYEGQSAPLRPATDVLLLGQAWAPKGAAAKRVDVTLAVAPHFVKTAAVFGERAFTQGGGAITPGSPRPFVAMPLVYERAFGGAEPGNHTPRAYEPRNPVGRGFFTSAADALYQPVANIEDPRALIQSAGDRPAPIGFGPIARSWQPRVRFGGTYDQRWVEELAPSWPPDFDVRFFQAAPLDQQVRGYLRGGERVAVSGVSPNGDIHFEVPRERVLLKGYFRGRVERKLMTLDSLLIEPDDGVFTLTWRASFRLPKGMFEHEHSVVRRLEPWEDAPR
ncbi:DUF2169 family type VI secretion system accessory protein [Sorangium sp. So ce131]|uniref:DUF2169 family type VI secretion system accessory protein n=1 Tax=Sorangium sp. So ce131 TaxID=3133282 RepID=UPI003F5F4002